jgi:POT family proton-dependent oligopeptide transporter
MLAGYLVFIFNKPRLEGRGEPPKPAELAQPVLGPLRLEWVIYLAAIAGVAVVWVLVPLYETMGLLLGAGWIAALAYLGLEMARGGKVVRERLMLAVILVVGSMLFFALAEQAGSSLNQFAERNTALPNAGFWTVTAAQTQAFNAGYILIFAPILSYLWAKLGQIGRDPNPLIKFGLGLIQIGAGFLVLVWSALYADASFRTPLFFLGFSYLLQTTGELFVSPVGLSEMTKLAPARMMAIWFLGASGSEWLAGLIAKTTASDTVAGQVLDPGKALATYAHTFLIIGGLGVAAGLVFLISSIWLKNWSHGVNDPANHPQQEATSPPMP